MTYTDMVIYIIIDSEREGEVRGERENARGRAKAKARLAVMERDGCGAGANPSPAGCWRLAVPKISKILRHIKSLDVCMKH